MFYVFLDKIKFRSVCLGHFILFIISNLSIFILELECIYTIKNEKILEDMQKDFPGDRRSKIGEKSWNFFSKITCRTSTYRMYYMTCFQRLGRLKWCTTCKCQMIDSGLKESVHHTGPIGKLCKLFISLHTKYNFYQKISHDDKYY